MKRLLYVALLFLCALSVNAQKYVGGDISLLPEYEDRSATYYQTDGTTQISDVLGYLSGQEWNAMRVRLFYDPSKAPSDEQKEGVVQDLEYVKKLGKRIKDAGFSFFLDLHYSDTWADPSNQWTPDAWTDVNDSEALYDSIYNYTKYVLETLVAYGATPDFIQTGNEISYGMLWGASGSSSYRCYINNSANWERFTTLLSNACKACREVCPDAKIVLHTERVSTAGTTYDAEKYFYTQMASYGVDYDIIGLSYYPYYHGQLKQLSTALTSLESTFSSKKIWIVETGYPHAYSWPTGNYSAEFGPSGSGSTYTEADQSDYTTALIDTLNNHAKVTGLFWWWPEANEKGINYTNAVTTGWYNQGLWDNSTGEAMESVSLLKNFLTETETEETNIYIVGDAPFGGWDPSAGVQMTNNGDGTYTYSATFTSKTVYFVFANALSSDWTVFNASYRYGPSSGSDEDVVLATETTTQLQGNGNGSYKFIGTAGNTYTFTFDLNKMTFKIEGEISAETETTYTVAGEPTELFGSYWDQTDTSNDMTLNEETGLYEWTAAGVELSAGTVQFKIVEDHDWGVNYPSSNYSASIANDGVYTVKITFDPETHEITFTATEGIVYEFGASGYGTLYYSQYNLKAPDDVCAGTYVVKDNELEMVDAYNPGDIIPAGTPVVILATQIVAAIEPSLAPTSFTAVFEVTDDEGTAATNNDLLGFDEDTETSVDGVTDGYKFYMLSLNAAGDASSVGFYFGADNGAPFTSKAHRAFLPVKDSQAAKCYLLKGQTTGIETVKIADFIEKNQPIYDITGRRVSNPQKGIYIVNGKKLVIK